MSELVGLVDGKTVDLIGVVANRVATSTMNDTAPLALADLVMDSGTSVSLIWSDASRAPHDGTRIAVSGVVCEILGGLVVLVSRTARHGLMTTALGREVVTALAAMIPEHLLLADPDHLSTYRMDQSLDEEAGTPLVVVRVETTQHVQHVLRTALHFAVPVVTRGAGTGLSGGCTAIEGCIILTTERMRSITIDANTKLAVVQPGAFNAEVKAAAAAHGLWYPPDPSSFEICSIGGNVATNAGGLCCVKYGVTTDYVLALEVVLADGTAIRVGGQTIKNSAGLSLTKLFVGSEGILGVITEVTLRLLPQQQAARTLVAFMDSIDGAAAAVVEIVSKSRPSMLELMDGALIRAVDDHLHMNLDRDAGAMLIAQSDLSGDAGAQELAIAEEACKAHGVREMFITDDPLEGELFLGARRAAIPSAQRQGSVLIEDVSVTVPRLPELLNGITAIAAATGATVGTIAHAGDGNTHPLVIFDPTDATSRHRAQLAFGQIMDLAIALDGTITGEHGTGRMKVPWLAAQIGEDAMALTRRIKDCLDPAAILNPGVILATRPNGS